MRAFFIFSRATIVYPGRWAAARKLETTICWGNPRQTAAIFYFVITPVKSVITNYLKT
jgi:hypothetical protein